MQGTPAQPSTAMPGHHIPIPINIEQDNIDGAPVEATQGQEEKKARRVYLKATDFETYGYSDNCEGCSRLQAGMDARPHTETCRARLDEELAKGDNRRWENAKDRELARTATDAALVRVREMREEKMREEQRRDANSTVLILSLFGTCLWRSGLPGPTWKLNMWSM